MKIDKVRDYVVENTKCISVYIEGLDCREAFIEACRDVVPKKPVVAIKGGGSKIGVKATFAHTASENEGTDDSLHDEIFEKAGAIRATTWQEFLDVSLALGSQPPLKGDNAVMITNGINSMYIKSKNYIVNYSKTYIIKNR